MNITDSYCGEAEQNGPLVGTIPLEASPAIVLNDTLVTSVVAMIQDDEEIVLFLGSSDGFIHKVSPTSTINQINIHRNNRPNYNYNYSVTITMTTMTNNL